MSVETRIKCWIPGTGVKDGCDLPSGFWDLNLGRQKEQQVLLNVELSLHPSPNMNVLKMAPVHCHSIIIH